MICKYCGNYSFGNDRFCTNCGSYLHGKRKNAIIALIALVVMATGLLLLYLVGNLILSLSNEYQQDNYMIDPLLSRYSPIDPIDKSNNRVRTSSVGINLITSIDYIDLYNNWSEYKQEYVKIAGRVSFVGYNETYKNTYLKFTDNINGEIFLYMQLPLSESTYKVGDKIIVIGLVSAWHDLEVDRLDIIECCVMSLGGDAEKMINNYADAKIKAESDRIKAEEDKKKTEEERILAEKAAAVKAEAEYKSKCNTVDYETIARDADGLKGQYFKFTGEVMQVYKDPETVSTVTYLVLVTKYEYGYTDIVYVMYNPPDDKPRILEDDIITFWGVSYGLGEYPTLLTGSNTVPKINAVYIDIVK